jgi:16S rRNA processing protein RimM
LVTGEEPWFTKIERVRSCQEDQLIKLADINTRDQAEKLAGGELVTHPEELEKLPNGTYYHFELLGMRVIDEDGRYLGTLEEIFSTGGNDVYVIRSNGDEILLPAIDEVIRQVDPPQKRMVVRLLKGLV